jgi:hypothetical protein
MCIILKVILPGLKKKNMETEWVKPAACMWTLAHCTFRLYFIGLRLAANNINLVIIAMEMQQWVHFALS